MPTCQNPLCTMHPHTNMRAEELAQWSGAHTHEWGPVDWDGTTIFECDVCHAHVNIFRDDPPPALPTIMPSVDSIVRELQRVRGEIRPGTVFNVEQLWTIIDALIFLAREKNGGPELFSDEEFDRQEREAIEGEAPSVYYLIRHPRL